MECLGAHHKHILCFRLRIPTHSSKYIHDSNTKFPFLSNSNRGNESHVTIMNTFLPSLSSKRAHHTCYRKIRKICLSYALQGTFYILSGFSNILRSGQVQLRTYHSDGEKKAVSTWIMHLLQAVLQKPISESKCCLYCWVSGAFIEEIKVIIIYCQTHLQ